MLWAAHALVRLGKVAVPALKRLEPPQPFSRCFFSFRKQTVRFGAAVQWRGFTGGARVAAMSPAGFGAAACTASHKCRPGLLVARAEESSHIVPVGHGGSCGALAGCVSLGGGVAGRLLHDRPGLGGGALGWFSGGGRIWEL